MARKLPKTSTTRSHHKIKTVVLPKQTVIRVEAPKDTIPMVIASAPGVVDIVSVEKKKGWMEYLFGKPNE